MCSEYTLLKSLERRDALRYVESQIKAHHGQAQALIDAFAKHLGHRDVIESFIDYNIRLIATLRKMQTVLADNINQSKSIKTMEAKTNLSAQAEGLKKTNAVLKQLCQLLKEKAKENGEDYTETEEIIKECDERDKELDSYINEDSNE